MGLTRFPSLLLQITLAMASLIFYLAWWMFYVWGAQRSLKQKLYSEHKMGHMHINFMVRSWGFPRPLLALPSNLCCQQASVRPAGATLPAQLTAECLCSAMLPHADSFHALVNSWAALTGCCLCLQKRRRLWGRSTVAALSHCLCTVALPWHTSVHVCQLPRCSCDISRRLCLFAIIRLWLLHQAELLLQLCGELARFHTCTGEACSALVAAVT